MNRLSSSFKDPSGFIFNQEGKIYRQINLSYRDNYELLKQSGLYDKLINQKALIPHREVSLPDLKTEAYKIIEPEQIPFISYPYEWCFSQLKEAALLTLHIQKEALNSGLSLKDASSFNIQFFKGKPIFIDTLSFEKYKEGAPWIAYKQFCENFLAPLALWVYRDNHLGKLLQTNLNGLPLDLTAKLLPWRARLNPSLYLHIFLHARSQRKTNDYLPLTDKQKFSKNSFLGLIDSLESGIKSLNWRGCQTIWADYYQEAGGKCLSYEPSALAAKKDLVSNYLNKIKTKKLWDIGANSGLFSKLAAEKDIEVIAIDYDPGAVEKNYLEIKKEGRENILPLLIDIINPTPALGWNNQEREAFLTRSRPDTILALALIHHLAIGQNLPLLDIAKFFAGHSDSLIIEFVPKSDKQVKSLLQIREDIFINYNIEQFELAFNQFFEIKEKAEISDSQRWLYLMTKK